VRDLHVDLKTISHMEEIRLLRSEVKGGQFDLASSDSLYADAFRDLGIDVDALDPAEAGSRVRARPLRLELAAALDDWTFVRRWVARPGWEHLTDVARCADPDPWRNRVRDFWQRDDPKALPELAASDEVGRMPPAAQVRLGRALAFVVSVERGPPCCDAVNGNTLTTFG